ncbi:MAG: DUF6923 family protein, partial [Phycisphaerales bacterium JB039]
MQIRTVAMALVAGSCAGAAAAQSLPPAEPDIGPPESRIIAPMEMDSRWVQHDGVAPAPQVVYETVLTVPGAAYVRFFLGEAVLSGDLELSQGSFIRLTSLFDGAEQVLNARSLRHWSNSTAYFRGDSVRVELIAHPRTGPSRVTIDRAIAGLGSVFLDTICGPTDDRRPTIDRRTGRWDWGCTIWLFDDRNHMLNSAGHCRPDGADLAWFNVPLATASGITVPPALEDQYPVDGTSVQSEASGIGADWAYIGVLPNSITGLMPAQAQGEWFTLADAVPAVAGQDIRITGHGTTDTTVPREWNRALKTHAGPYVTFSGTSLGYQPDTSGGNSGSAVQDESTGLVIGVHTHGGCRSDGTGNNWGTAIDRPGWQNAHAAPRGTAGYGRAPVAPPLYVSNDEINLFGTLDRASGAFGSVGYTPPDMRGLAWAADAGRLIGVDGGGKLWEIDPASGASLDVATITGAGLINGLAFDNATGTLYGISALSGQIYRIDRGSGAATAIGSPLGGSMSGLAFNDDDRMLYATNDGPGATQLMRINPATGAGEVVGSLGLGASDCDGLAYCADDGMLYTLDDATDTLYRVNPATGAGVAIGSTGSPFDVDFGLACVTETCRVDLNGDGLLDIF